MAKPRLCLIFEAIGFTSGIGKVAYQDVSLALNAGYEVTVIAQQLHPSLHTSVEWLPLYVPPRLFLLKWATAHHFMRKALGDQRFDIIHSHQPQGAILSDIFTCHFLTRVAYERNCLVTGKSISARAVRAQQQVVLKLEDRCYQQRNPATQVVFCSELLRDEFHRLYGTPRNESVIENACVSAAAYTYEERIAARQDLFEHAVSTPVVGYFGGVDERKGYRAMLAALRHDPSLHAILAGPGTDKLSSTEFSNRVHMMGPVTETDRFYAACDILVVPSVFDPCPMVVLEAVARQIPVIATRGVGNLAQVQRCNAGLEWKPQASLSELVRYIELYRESFVAGADRMAHELTEARRAARMIAVYEHALTRNSPGIGAPSP
jgi:glycosyltransferase involved in cell wall biosynthesis